MIPILYSPEEVLFETMGIGPLSDATSCVVTESLNGGFELVLKYPVGGVYFHDITYRSLILAKPNAEDREQPFRVYKISRPMNGVITVNAEHISYDLAGIQVSPFDASNAADALKGVQNGAVTDNLFTFHTDKLTEASMKISKPRSARACLLGERGSVLDVYGGEYLFDHFHVELLQARGADRGYSIRYGVNLTDIKQEQSCQNTYTGIYPYWYSEESGTLVQLPERIVYAAGDFGYTRIKNVDLTSEFDEEPGESELRARAEKYVADNQIGRPSVNITLKFEQLRQYEEYKDMTFLEEVRLGDTVSVFFEKLGVDANAKCVKTVYDVLLEKYDSLSLGDLKQTVADTVVTLEDQISETVGQMRNIAKITAVTTANSAKLELLVETDADGKNSVRGSMLIEAINGESVAKIRADRIELEGLVTVEEEGGEEKTYITGGAIRTGEISGGYMHIDLDGGYMHIGNNFNVDALGYLSASGANISGKITSQEGSFGAQGQVEITNTGLKCGNTTLTDGGVTTTNGSQTTILAGGVLRFGSSVTLYAADSPVSGGTAFLGVYIDNQWKTLYYGNDGYVRIQ